MAVQQGEIDRPRGEKLLAPTGQRWAHKIFVCASEMHEVFLCVRSVNVMNVMMRVRVLNFGFDHFLNFEEKTAKKKSFCF